MLNWVEYEKKLYDLGAWSALHVSDSIWKPFSDF